MFEGKVRTFIALQVQGMNAVEFSLYPILSFVFLYVFFF